MARPIRTLSISAEQRRALHAIVNRPSAPHRDNRRAWIILNRADGLSQTETARMVGVRQSVVVQWEQRFEKSGIAGLSDAKGRGRKPRIAPQIREKIIVGATRPPKNRTRWSVRTMAKAMDVSKATVQRLWSANAVKPHVTRTFKISNDKNFEKKFWDVIGLYLNPPDRALVLCCDEKSQCQALERTQPSLPVMRGYRRTQTHDYKRHGTITLFAGLSYLDGKNIQPDRGKAYPSAVVGLLEATRPGDPRGFDVARYRRQLQHSQTRQGEIVDTVAEPKAAESFRPGPHAYPLHPNLQFLDESGGAILPGYHRGRCSGRQLHHRRPIS